MKTINDIAASAYNAHAKELHRSIGVSARPWGELPHTEVQCWEQSTRQVLAEVAAMGCLVGVGGLPTQDVTSIKPTEVQP